jgi:hypothetical protein
MSEESKIPAAATPEPAESGPSTAAPSIAEGSGEQSKKGAKKAEAKAKKEAEKARKAAEREVAAKAQAASQDTEDLAKDNYGPLPVGFKSEAPRIRLEELTDDYVGKLVKIRGSLQNLRMQGAKIAFIELGKGNESIQGVVAVSKEGKPVSRQMVKWVGSVKLESCILVEAIVEKPLDPVKSCSISGFELHVQKLYVVSTAPEMLPLSIATASRAVGSVDEDEDLAKKADGKLSQSRTWKMMADILQNFLSSIRMLSQLLTSAPFLTTQLSESVPQLIELSRISAMRCSSCSWSTFVERVSRSLSLQA